jgi:integrase
VIKEPAENPTLQRPFTEISSRDGLSLLGGLNIRDVRTINVEQWLRRLLRVDGRPLANSTKAKIRNLMSVLFNHAIRHEWLEQGKNPILLVRQSAKRQRIPEWLEPEELRALLSQLDRRFRVMVFLDAATGLRRTELLALKWRDIEFENLQIIVQRSIYGNVAGNCKTEASKKPVPMDPILGHRCRVLNGHSGFYAHRRSPVIHLRMYAGQFSRVMLSASQLARNVTTSWLTSVTFLKSKTKC